MAGIESKISKGTKPIGQTEKKTSPKRDEVLNEVSDLLKEIFEFPRLEKTPSLHVQALFVSVHGFFAYPDMLWFSVVTVHK